jgi:exo-beta-1,3-glucanase (GH17 family)
VAANSTVYVVSSPVPKTSSSTTCTEGEKSKTPIYTPSSSAVWSSSTPAAPTSSKPAVVYPTAPKPESSKAVPVYSSAPMPVYSSAPAPVYSSKAAPSSSKVADKPKPSGSYSSTPYIVTKDNKWAITYTPYAANGQCKTSDAIKSDVEKIAQMGFTTIRSYSTDCGVFEYVVPECQKHGLKIIYGIFLEAGGKGTFSDYANAQLTDIKTKAPKDSIAMVIVGNECIFNGNCQPADLASYIDYVRKELQAAGFPTDVAITTTEPVGVWEEKGAALCDHIDVFTVQVHPYFTTSVTAEMAGDFAAQQLEQAAKVCPGAAAKGKYITEIGWPKEGAANGLAVAGVEEQKVAMKKIQEKVGVQSCLFSFQDDNWKEPGSLGVEQHFGCTSALGY